MSTLIPREMKHVLVTCGSPDLIPVIFPHDLMHRRVACGSGRPVSAGFCTIEPDGMVIAYGGSESLDLESQPGDADIIQRHLWGPT